RADSHPRSSGKGLPEGTLSQGRQRLPRYSPPARPPGLGGGAFCPQYQGCSAAGRTVSAPPGKQDLLGGGGGGGPARGRHLGRLAAQAARGITGRARGGRGGGRSPRPPALS